MEILRVCAYMIRLRDLAELEHCGNIREVHLCWKFGFSVKEALPILETCPNLRRLTMEKLVKLCFPPTEELCDFIMKMKHLTFLHIIYIDSDPCDHFKSEVDEVNAFVLPLRPNFKFDISCCEKSKVNSCNTQHVSYFPWCWLNKIIRSLSFIFGTHLHILRIGRFIAFGFLCVSASCTLTVFFFYLLTELYTSTSPTKAACRRHKYARQCVDMKFRNKILRRVDGWPRVISERMVTVEWQRPIFSDAVARCHL